MSTGNNFPTPEQSLANVIIFAPDRWGTLTKFRKFAHSTYTFRGKANEALSGIEGHIQKSGILLALAKRLSPDLR